jgi:hypothetical protein
MLLFNYPESREEIIRVGLETIFTDDYLELAQLALDNLSGSDSDQTLGHLAEKFEKPEHKTLFSRIMVSDGQLDNIEWRTVLNQCTRSHEKKKLSSIKEIAARLAVVDANSDEFKELLKQADSLRTRKSKL